jgi:toxin HigB-1
MQVEFNDAYLEKLYQGKVKGKQRYNNDIVKRFRRVIDTLKNTANTHELSKFAGLNFEALKGDKKGLFSVRVSKEYRLEFYLEKDEIKIAEIVVVQDLSNHYD